MTHGRPSVFKQRRGAGFTLIELLVAIGVTAMLVGLMLSIVTNVMASWNRSSGALDANAQARVVLDQLSLDLQSAIMRRDANGVWLLATVSSTGDESMSGASWSQAKPSTIKFEPDSHEVDESWSSYYRFGRAGVWLRFFTVGSGSSASSSYSAPAAVAYQMVRRQVGDAYSYQLFRSQVSPENTFNVAAGYDLTATEYNTADQAEGAPGNVRSPNINYLLANHVVDFGVRFWNGGDLVFPHPNAAPGFAATNRAAGFMSSDGVSVDVTRFPTSAEIMVRILTPEGARLIQAFEEDSSRFQGQTWWSIAEQHSKVYTRRIELKGTAL